MDIHNYKGRYNRTIERINDSKEISKENKENIFKFRDYLLSEGVGLAKIERYLGDVVKLSKMLKKPFPKANKEDIRHIVGEIEQTELAPWTKRSFKIVVRKFYKFIRGIDEKGIYPDEVKWISLHIANNHKKLPEELLTEEEIKKIIQKCSNLRDKALFSTLAESGCRISEIGTMKIRHIVFEEYGARLTVTGKTGMRKILVINSTPYLQQWINEHPENDNPDAYLWHNAQGEGFLQYTRIAAILKLATKRAGIKKRVYLHLLRHSRATALASIMPEASMKQYLGWTQSSSMAGVYIHMSGKDTDEAILKANGIEIKKEDKKESKLKPVTCLRCKTINPSTNRCCNICGFILNEEYANEKLKEDAERMEADQIMDKIVKDPEILELIKKKLGLEG